MIPKIFPVTCHTKHVGKNSTFVAIKGYTINGERYIEKAIELGATTIIVDTTYDTKKLLKQYPAVQFRKVTNTRKSLALLSAQALHYPSKNLIIIGITGTKGKSSTAYLTHHILKESGYKTALISGIKNRIGNEEQISSLTSPSSDYLHMFFHTCIQQKITHVVMEVSSHAASLYRTHGIEFAALGFSNLDSEHMDFYSSMDEYFQAKYLLFSQLAPAGTAVINLDNFWSKKAYNQLRLQKKSVTLEPYSTDKKCKNHFTIQQNSLNGINIQLLTPNQAYSLETQKIFGTFNAYNTCMATLLSQTCNINQKMIQKAILSFPGTPGRLEQYTLRNGAKAFVDFAHNTSGMNAVLQTLRPLTKNLIVVFGCGGDRDKTKRPHMAKLAEKYGDIIIVTNDNPRNEDPKIIVEQIKKGFSANPKPKILYELDRKIAIAQAVHLAKPDSILALLGKGHEAFYLIKGTQYYLSDQQELQQYSL